MEKNKLPMVSIMVPVYNVEKYLSKCIDSLVNQTYENYEIILVNDGSTDGCGKICDDYAEKYGRIRVYHQKNLGVSAARNYGIDVAKGEFISFVDADDWLDTRYLEKLIAAQVEHDVDLTMCEFTNILEANGTERRMVSFDGDIYYSGGSMIESYVLPKTLMNNNRQMIGNPYCKLYKMKLLEEYKIRFNEELKLHEDRLFNYEYVQHIVNFCYIAETYYYRLVWKGSSMRIFRKNIYEEYIKICKVYTNMLMKHEKKLWEIEYFIPLLISDVLGQYVCNIHNTEKHKKRWENYYQYLSEYPMCDMWEILSSIKLQRKKDAIRFWLVQHHQTYVLELLYKVWQSREKI